MFLVFWVFGNANAGRLTTLSSRFHGSHTMCLQRALILIPVAPRCIIGVIHRVSKFCEKRHSNMTTNLEQEDKGEEHRVRATPPTTSNKTAASYNEISLQTD